MAQVNTKIKFTYKDYKSLPESETQRYELLKGELVMVPSPSTYHQRISRRLEFCLLQHIEREDLGEIFDAPFDVVFGEGREVVQPDILYVAKDHSEIITEQEIQGVPDLIIEILSPSTAERDRTYKRTLYARQGVREYWIVDPEAKSIEVLTLGERGFELAMTYAATARLSSPLLKGLSIDLGEVFG